MVNVNINIKKTLEMLKQRGAIVSYEILTDGKIVILPVKIVDHIDLQKIEESP